MATSTFAPDNLRRVRTLLLEHLDFHKGSYAYPADLDPDEVGIVGNAAHRGGYHCGRDRLDPRTDYSVAESSRDRNGLSFAASAIDVGQFSVAAGGGTHDLRSFSAWLVRQCQAGTPDSQAIREVIYSPDGRAVKRWDRLRRRGTGDSSHLYHTHVSYFRDTENSDKVPLYRRYLEEIGVIRMALTQADAKLVVDTLMARKLRSPLPDDQGADPPVEYAYADTFRYGRTDTRREVDRGVEALLTRFSVLEAKQDQALAKLDEILDALGDPE